MKLLLSLLVLLSSLTPGEAKKLSACHKECFNQQYHCNIKKSGIYNSCSDELFSCRASCQSGKPQNSYATNKLPIAISFYPTVTK